MSYGILRQYISESIRGVYFFGLKKASINDIRNGWPKLYDFLEMNHGDLVPSCKCAIKKRDDQLTSTPFVMLPDSQMSVVTWDHDNERPVYSQSEDISRSIERLK